MSAQKWDLVQTLGYVTEMQHNPKIVNFGVQLVCFAYTSPKKFLKLLKI